MPDTIEDLIAITKLKPPDCWRGYKALSERGSLESLNAIIELTANNDWTHRRVAIEAIGNHKQGLLAEGLLMSFLNDNTPYILKTSISALAKIRSLKAHDKIYLFA